MDIHRNLSTYLIVQETFVSQILSTSNRAISSHVSYSHSNQISDARISRLWELTIFFFLIFFEKVFSICFFFNRYFWFWFWFNFFNMFWQLWNFFELKYFLDTFLLSFMVFAFFWYFFYNFFSSSSIFFLYIFWNFNIKRIP